MLDYFIDSLIAQSYCLLNHYSASFLSGEDIDQSLVIMLSIQRDERVMPKVLAVPDEISVSC
jgi:hypothetical protein